MDRLFANTQECNETYKECIYLKMTEMDNQISDNSLKKYMYNKDIWSLNYTKEPNKQAFAGDFLFTSAQIEIEFRFFLLHMYFQEKCTPKNIQVYLSRMPLMCKFLKMNHFNCLSLLELSETEINQWSTFAENNGQINRFKNFLGRVQQQLKVEYYDSIDKIRLDVINRNPEAISKEEKLLFDSITQQDHFNSLVNRNEDTLNTLYINNFWNIGDNCFRDILLPEFEKNTSKERLKRMYFFHPNHITRLEFKSVVYFLFLKVSKVASNKVLNLFLNTFQPYFIRNFSHDMCISKMSSAEIVQFENYCKDIGDSLYKTARSAMNHLNNWKFTLFDLPTLTVESYLKKYNIWKSAILRNYFDIGVRAEPDGDIDFNNVSDSVLKKYLKQFLIKRLIENRLSFSSTKRYFKNIIKLLDVDSTKLSDDYLIKAIENFYSMQQAQANSDSKKQTFNQVLFSIRDFLSYLNKYHEFDFEIKRIFPSELFFKLSFSKSENNNAVKYIDEKALESIILNLHTLDSPYSEIVFLAFYTGQRLSDIISLKTKDVCKENSEYFLLLDINKTKVERHYVPLPKEFGKYLYKFSNGVDTKFLFQSKSDYRRKNLPINSNNVRSRFRGWIKEKDIRNNNGSSFSLNIHAFRHTFAVKLLNSGTDIVTVSNFLAHISLEMTLHYAKMLDISKFQRFKESIAPIVASNSSLEVFKDDEVKKKLLQSFYHSEKINKFRTPYGTCFASKINRCPYIDAPPCLANDDGRQCSHLKIDQTYLEKYYLLRNELIVSNKQAKRLDRLDIIKKSEQLLNTYTKIIKELEKNTTGGD